MLELLGSPWIQLFMWFNAGLAIILFSNDMRGGKAIWILISIGIFLIGIRIGYKLLPFYKYNEFTEAVRYFIGILGVVILFMGFSKYTEMLRHHEVNEEDL